MPNDPLPVTDETLEELAYEAFDRGRLSDASRYFAKLLERQPDAHHLHHLFMSLKLAWLHRLPMRGKGCADHRSVDVSSFS